MAIKLGVIMDPIGGINIKKDTTFAMMLAAQARGLEIYYMEQKDLSVVDSKAFVSASRISVEDNEAGWYQLGERRDVPLNEFDVLLMRKDPPFDIEYVYTTYILELVQKEGVLVINDPAGLRDISEKMFINFFPQCIAPTLVSRSKNQIKKFLDDHRDIVVKPLHGMGGQSVFHIAKADKNTNVILETLTEHESRFIMAQKYLPAISEGDKRILLIDGKPFDYALARIPMEGETRGNLAAGGTGEGVELSERDRWICDQVGPRLRDMGMLFVGLDVIGDYLTEINVTSPTCVRELDAIYHLDIAGLFIETVKKRVKSGKSIT